MGGLRRGVIAQPHCQKPILYSDIALFRIPVLANLDTGAIIFAIENFVASSSSYRSS